MAKFSAPIHRLTTQSALHPGHQFASSKYGPKIFYQTHIGGFTLKQLFGFGLRAGAMGGSALLAVLFFASGIPRLQDDVLKQIPGMSRVYEKKIHPADNPF